MNDIEHDKAQCWCNRLHKLMKEKNYTQKSFLKEYKEKYGGGTQANISRWLRVGSKIENGKTIGFPSYETMSNLADFFGVSVGYLIGETDYESFEMEKVCEFLGLEEETVKAIIGITSGENMGIGANSMCSEYKSAFRYILTASSFHVFIKEVREYAENVYRLKHPIKYMDIVSAKMRKDLFDLAVKCMDYQCISDDKYGRIDDFEENSVVYRNSIRRLTEKLKICLETQDETFPTMATHGKICPSKVWKAIYLDNPRVFEKKEEVEIPGFSVDIMIDASSSRKPMQEKIAAQAYILARSLEMCKIPAQIYSYCSIRGYTVMRIFKSYEENQKEDEIFRYVAAGNNRDGLAFRAAGHLAEKSEKSKKILLVLTDASPQDDQDAGEGAFYKNNEYTDLVAIQDTTKEVQALRRKGMQVIGIFMGSERGGAVAGKIFGHDLVKIQNISEFSDAVGCILQQVIENRV